MPHAGKEILLNEEVLRPWLSDKKPWVTYLLVAVNVLLFLAMLVSTHGACILDPTPQQLIDWGANYAPLTFNGQDWRLLSSGFLHIGAMHLLMNMFVLWIFGKLCERLFGSGRFFVIYMLSGLGAALLSDLSCLIFGPAMSAGASGSICGILAAYFSLIRHHREELGANYRPMMRKFGEYAIVTVLYGFLAHADHAAHLGGVLTGAWLGAVLTPQVTNEGGQKKQLVMVAAVCLALGGLWFLETSGIADITGNLQLSRAQMASKVGDKSGALATFKKLVERYPNNEQLYVDLAGCEVEQNDIAAATETLNTVLKINPKNYAACSLATFTAYRQGEFARCLDLASKIPADSPFYKKITSVCVSHIHAVQGKLKEALQEAEIDPGDAAKTKMIIYSQAGMDSDAEKSANELLKTQPNNRDALYVLLISEWRKRHFEEVMKLAEKMDNSAGNDPSTHSYASFAYTLGALMAKDKNPNLLLERNSPQIDKNQWTKSIADYFEKRITESQLIRKASDPGQRTEAYSYIGLNKLAQNQIDEAKPYLTWVQQNGVATYYEASMVKAALDSPGQR